jgi:serine protease Do
MKRLHWSGLLLVAAVGLTATGCTKQIDFQGIIATAKSQVYPALVFVKPIQETFVGGERQRTEVLGSGVVISADGYVVTNNHVAEKAIEVNCVLGDREQVPATVVGVDPETDLALLKLTLPADRAPLPVAEFGDSNEVKAGEFVMALGSPFGFTRSISLGIISNTTRYIGFTTQHRYNLWLQTDAAINPGNSGGPLVDTEGRVIGINTLGVSSGSIGFAIPSNVVRDVIDRLKLAAAKTDKDKWPVKVQRTYTGLQLQALNDFNTNTFTDSTRGVLIQNVDAESPAMKAGIKNGDILLAVNDVPVEGLYVEDLPALRVSLADLPVDKPAKLLIARKGVKTDEKLLSGGDEHLSAAVAYRQDCTTAVGKRGLLMLPFDPITRGKFEGEDFDCKRWNLTVKEITKFSNPSLHFLHPAGGVFIQGVRYPGNASDAELQVNDIILTIGKATIKTNADVKKAYEALIGDKALAEKKVLFKIKRNGFIDWKILNWQKDYLQED